MMMAPLSHTQHKHTPFLPP